MEFGTCFFPPTALRHLSKQLFYVIISGAPFSSIFNHLRYSLNTSHKAFRHVTTTREMRRPACEVLSSLDAPFSSACRKSVTQDLQIEQCTSLSGYPIRSTKTSHSHYTAVSRPISASSGSIYTHRQTFSTAYRSYDTVVTQNPRVDEDGKDMTIKISPRAAKVC